MSLMDFVYLHSKDLLFSSFRDCHIMISGAEIFSTDFGESTEKHREYLSHLPRLHCMGHLCARLFDWEAGK